MTMFKPGDAVLHHEESIQRGIVVANHTDGYTLVITSDGRDAQCRRWTTKLLKPDPEGACFDWVRAPAPEGTQWVLIDESEAEVMAESFRDRLPLLFEKSNVRRFIELNPSLVPELEASVRPGMWLQANNSAAVDSMRFVSHEVLTGSRQRATERLWIAYDVYGRPYDYTDEEIGTGEDHDFYECDAPKAYAPTLYGLLGYAECTGLPPGVTLANKGTDVYCDSGVLHDAGGSFGACGHCSFGFVVPGVTGDQP